MLSVASCSGIRKRSSDFEDTETVNKIPRTQLYVVLESESDVTSSGEDTESILSIQNQSTDLAKDTSDTSSKTSRYDGSEAEGVEYEVVSLSEADQDKFFDTCSSGSDSEVWRKRLGDNEPEDKAGQSMWADSSSDATTDPTGTGSKELQPLRLRPCFKCKAQTYFQYCTQCFKVRKSFFLARPKRRKKRSSATSRKKPFKENTKLPLSKTNSCVESSSSQELILTPSDFNSPSTSKASERLCNVCFVNPKNAAFVHLQWGHIFACYQCSLKIWFSSKCCPLCNNKIRQVIKISEG